MADVILRGKAGGYPSDIKMVYSAYGNLLNQISNLNKSVEAYRKLEFVVVQDQFITPTARFADILLPAATAFERNDIHLPWSMAGHYALYMQKAMEPMGKSGRITTFARTWRGASTSTASMPNQRTTGCANSSLPSEIEDYDSFKATGVARLAPPDHAVAFAAEIADPANHPFSTPTGKIEIYATRLAENPDPYGLGTISPVRPGWTHLKGSGTRAGRGIPSRWSRRPHSKARTHSTHANQPMLDKLEPAGVSIHPEDAAVRGIVDGQTVRVFNDRGALVLQAVVSDGMARGVVAMTEGRWYAPGADGVDFGGNPNLVSLSGSALSLRSDNLQQLPRRGGGLRARLHRPCSTSSRGRACLATAGTPRCHWIRLTRAYLMVIVEKSIRSSGSGAKFCTFLL